MDVDHTLCLRRAFLIGTSLFIFYTVRDSPKAVAYLGFVE